MVGTHSSSTSASTSLSDDTITPSRHAHGREYSDAADGTDWNESSQATTACNTVSAPPEPDKFELKRKSFKRPPIPDLFRSTSSETEEKQDFGVVLGFGVQAHLDSDQDDTFPQSPGHSPLSRFERRPSKHSPLAPRRFSLSPPSLALPIGLRRKQSRGRSCSDPFARKQLHPSPPPLESPHDDQRQTPPLQVVGLVGHRLEPEVLIGPAAVIGRKKVTRKPIPLSLLSGDLSTADTAISAFTPTASCPDGFFLSPELQASPGAHIEPGNKLGLFSAAEPLEALDSLNLPIDPELAVVGQNSANRNLAVLGPIRPGRLRRATRSVSESHDRAKSSLRSQDEKLRASLDARFGLGVGDTAGWQGSPTSSQSSDPEQVIPEARSWSPSPPTGSSAEFAGEEYGTKGALRRVSRTKEGEMRSGFLSSPTRHSHTGLDAAAISGMVAPDEGDGLEILKTPDPAFNAAFEHSMSSSLSLAPRSGGELWGGSLASRARSSSETSMASLLVLQQHIQQRNHQRQFAPPVADPHPLPESERTRSREASYEEQRHVLHADERRKQARVRSEGMGSSEQELIQQYGAMRIRSRTGDVVGTEDEQCELAYLVDEDASAYQSRQATQGNMRLRHMFSSPLLASASMLESEGDTSISGVSLRQRRAKPPISIALRQPTTDELTKNGAVGTLRKRGSKTSVLSPASVHSPPPCPPPATPLPQLPTPRSAPIIPLGGPRRGLMPKRSFARSNSTPVSPFTSAPPLRPSQHAQTQSQGQNIVPSTQTAPQAQAWNDFAPPHSSLLTPPLTGLPSLVFDHQPSTPASASATTPVKSMPPTTRHKFDSLLAFLSSSEDHKTQASPAKTVTDTEEHAFNASSGPTAAVVYGLAL